MSDNRVTIYSGADISSIIRLKNPKTGDPINLTDMTKISFLFKNRDRSTLELDNTEVPATKASFTYESVTFTAVSDGVDGNDIILQFDGINSIDSIVNTWNTNNPSNQVQHNGTGSDVLSAGTVRLTDGYNAYKPVEVQGDPLLGKVKLAIIEKQSKYLKRGPNQSFSVVIDYGTFPGGTRIKGFYNKLDVLDDM